MTHEISIANLITRDFLAELTPLQRAILAYRNDVWARPEQRMPSGDWRWIFFRAGRGWGKTTHCIAPEIVRRVASGDCKSLALVAPSEDRAEQVQIQALIDASPPWFAAERYQGGIRWPNGVRGYVFSPGANAPRGSTFSHGWATELVDWAPMQRVTCWEQLSITVRKPGTACKIYIDSTASGKSDLFAALDKQHRENPARCLIVNGTTFDNPLLSRKYLQSVCAPYTRGSRRFREELMGESFQESAGALWRQEWIDNNRRPSMPIAPTIRVVAWDPALSADASADEAGISMASVDADGHFHIEIDESARMTQSDQAKRAFDLCLKYKASGVVVERNRVGDAPHDLLVLIAAARGLRVERLSADRPMPAWRAGTIYLREYKTDVTKMTRAEPVAKLAEDGRVHHVGHLDALELEMTSWEPDSRRSPNRLDAAAYAVAELAALGRPAARPLGDMSMTAVVQRQVGDALRHMGARRIL